VISQTLHENCVCVPHRLRQVKQVSSGGLDSAKGIADWLRSHRTKGFDLSYPYGRKWEIGGCIATHSLWAWPTDRILDLSIGIASCGHRVFGVEGGVLVVLPDSTIKVSANRSSPGEGPPDAYSFFESETQSPCYTGNSPEIIVMMLRGFEDPSPPLVESEIVEIGFPGRPESDLTYVGSWQWDVHGEARGSDFVRRASAATLDAINVRKATHRPDGQPR
jgi:hypothetical protein